MGMNKAEKMAVIGSATEMWDFRTFDGVELVEYMGYTDQGVGFFTDGAEIHVGKWIPEERVVEYVDESGIVWRVDEKGEV